MPPHLHPRSRATSTLFAGTLIASFAVVAVPHIWPCPRPKKAFMDGEIVFDENGRAMRRVRRKKNSDAESVIEESHISKHGSGRKSIVEEAELMKSIQAEADAIEKDITRSECPLPKPTGIVGRWLGFEEQKPVQRNDK